VRALVQLAESGVAVAVLAVLSSVAQAQMPRMLLQLAYAVYTAST
jgi:hypothetical protein